MTDNRYAPPKSHVEDMNNAASFEYVGFWPRVGAVIIDAILSAVVFYPLMLAIYGKSYFAETARGVNSGMGPLLLSWVLPAIVIIAFWVKKQATPGKMLIGAKIVDAKTGGPLSVGQAVGRYVIYILSSFLLCIGLIWVAFDARKQGWHDKVAGTLVVRAR